MNFQKVGNLLNHYKNNFERVNRLEIYKWRMVKRFQDSWDGEAEDFSGMLDTALKLTNNILDSGRYFPKRMLLKNSERSPEKIRELFKNLFNEELDLPQRIVDFKQNFSEINERNFPGKNPFQDDRAILVYLSLRYPNSYYLYKYTMFKDFVGLVDFPYRPIRGRLENVMQYLTLCNLLKEEIARDLELLDLQKTRIGPGEYVDNSFTVLTQDVIYATTVHLPTPDVTQVQPTLNRLELTELAFSPGAKDVALTGSFTNYLELQRERKRIGDLGELLVLDWEKKKLARLGLRKQPEHHSASTGDGLGYDILSYDEHGETVYIEVKTTTGTSDRPFFITANELERSRRNPNQFVLYRLYDFDPEVRSAKFFKIRGDLSALCNNPILFQAIPEIVG